ncbi:hypothetical protein ACQQ2N_08530 [Dokdonella sp. MW10]|uniref:hypothetical protein n=1 Tax=Dokdonella sp. MW10 TaxID=2992926 RepID=UPI003F822886
MKRFFEAMLAKLDAASPRVFLYANLAIAGFVLLAHGLLLLVLHLKPSIQQPEGMIGMTMVSLPVAGLVILSSVGALFVDRARAGVLAFHGASLMLGALAMLAFALHVVLWGMSGGNVSWTPGLFSLGIAYAAFVFTRYTVPVAWRSNPAITFAPVWSLAIALVVEAAILVRLVGGLVATPSQFT